MLLALTRYHVKYYFNFYHVVLSALHAFFHTTPYRPPCLFPSIRILGLLLVTRKKLVICSPPKLDKAILPLLEDLFSQSMMERCMQYDTCQLSISSPGVASRAIFMISPAKVDITRFCTSLRDTLHKHRARPLVVLFERNVLALLKLATTLIRLLRRRPSVGLR